MRQKMCWNWLWICVAVLLHQAFSASWGSFAKLSKLTLGLLSYLKGARGDQVNPASIHVSLKESWPPPSNAHFQSRPMDLLEYPVWGKYGNEGLLKSRGVKLWMHRRACWSNSFENGAAVDSGRAVLKWVEAVEPSLEAALFMLHSSGPSGAWVLLGKCPRQSTTPGSTCELLVLLQHYGPWGQVSNTWLYKPFFLTILNCKNQFDTIIVIPKKRYKI